MRTPVLHYVEDMSEVGSEGDDAVGRTPPGLVSSTFRLPRELKVPEPSAVPATRNLLLRLPDKSGIRVLTDDSSASLLLGVV